MYYQQIQKRKRRKGMNNNNLNLKVERLSRHNQKFIITKKKKKKKKKIFIPKIPAKSQGRLITFLTPLDHVNSTWLLFSSSQSLLGLSGPCKSTQNNEK
jgi:hypothetical protein